jgi:hypothetical protein
LKKKVYFDPLIVPGSFDFGIATELIIFHGYYINEWKIPNENKYMFLLNHECDLIGKRILNLNIEDFILTKETNFFCKIKSGEVEMFDLNKVTFDDSLKVIDCDFDQPKHCDYNNQFKNKIDGWKKLIFTKTFRS